MPLRETLPKFSLTIRSPEPLRSKATHSPNSFEATPRTLFRKRWVKQVMALWCKAAPVKEIGRLCRGSRSSLRAKSGHRSTR